MSQKATAPPLSWGDNDNNNATAPWSSQNSHPLSWSSQNLHPLSWSSQNSHPLSQNSPPPLYQSWQYYNDYNTIQPLFVFTPPPPPPQQQQQHSLFVESRRISDHTITTTTTQRRPSCFSDEDETRATRVRRQLVFILLFFLCCAAIFSTLLFFLPFDDGNSSPGNFPIINHWWIWAIICFPALIVGTLCFVFVWPHSEWEERAYTRCEDVCRILMCCGCCHAWGWDCGCCC